MDTTTEAWGLTDLFSMVRLFRNREQAGLQLATRLEALRSQDVLVLGIPRGGVPVAAQVARRLEADLDVIVARKLGAPCQPELALGAVAADGTLYLNETLVDGVRLTHGVLQWLIETETAEARGRAARFRGNRPPPRVKGRTVVVVDDGLATGATMRAAVRSIRTRGPARIIIATLVGSRDTCADLRNEVDHVVVLYEPEPFLAVGVYYADFRPTSDRDVERLLQLQHALAPRDRAVA
jgi:putative phosphoribosyl transferase